MKPGKTWWVLKNHPWLPWNNTNYWGRKEGLQIWSIIEMINFLFKWKLNKFAYLYSKPLGNHTLKIMKILPGNLLKTRKSHGNIMEFCQSEKVGTLQLRKYLPCPMILTPNKWNAFQNSTQWPVFWNRFVHNFTRACQYSSYLNKWHLCVNHRNSKFKMDEK